MLQLNLLPDVKKELLHARRMRNLVMTVCIFVSGGAIAVAIIFSLVLGGTVLRKDSLAREVDENIAKIDSEKSKHQLTDYLSVQNDLSLISSIKKSQPQLSRLYDYLDVIFGRTTPIIGLEWTDWEELKVNTEGTETTGVTMELTGQVDTEETRLMLRNRLYYAMVKYSEYSADGDKVVEGDTKTDQKLFPTMVPTVDFEGGSRDETTGKWPFKATVTFNPIVFQTMYRIQSIEIDYCTVWSATYNVIGEGCQGDAKSTKVEGGSQ
jgi:hypothetical protein